MKEYGRIGSALAGAAAGVAATLAMSPVMSPRLTARASAPLRHVRGLDEFPPRRVVQAGEEIIAGERKLPDRAEVAATWLAHLGYGAAVGAIYGVMAPSLDERIDSPVRGAAAGALFGLGVWAAGYAGWLPLVGIRTGTIRGDRRDLPWPLAAHVVYGATLGAVHDALS